MSTNYEQILDQKVEFVHTMKKLLDQHGAAIRTKDLLATSIDVYSYLNEHYLYEFNLFDKFHAVVLKKCDELEFHISVDMKANAPFKLDVKRSDYLRLHHEIVKARRLIQGYVKRRAAEADQAKANYRAATKGKVLRSGKVIFV